MHPKPYTAKALQRRKAVAPSSNNEGQAISAAQEMLYAKGAAIGFKDP